MKKKKLVFLINDLPFFMSHRLPIALNAVKNGYDVRIFTGQPASVQMYNSYKNINNKFNFPITELNFKSSDLNLFNNFYVFIKILNTFKKINPDILHVVSMKSIILGGMIARLINIKFLVISFSGFGYLFTGKKTFFERILIFLFLFLLKIICKHKNKKIICQNFVDKTFVLKNGLAKNKEIIFIKGSGVDLKLYKKIKYNINNNVVLMPSRLLKNKGVIDFFEAA